MDTCGLVGHSVEAPVLAPVRFFFFDEKIRGTVLTVLFFVRRREKMYAIGHAGSQHCSTELQGSCVFRLGRKSLPVLGLK